MRRFLSAVAVLLLVFLPPVALAAWGFTDWGSIRLWSVSDIRILMGVLTVVGWLAWGVWMVALILEVWVAISGRRIGLALPGLSLPRALASALITAVLASGAQVAHAHGPGDEAAAQPAIVTTDVLVITETATDPSDETPLPDHVVHEVTRGDDLWSLAMQYYGDGARWRTIVAANPALQADANARLVAGSSLVIPEPTDSVQVEPGDTLTALAQTHLGEADRWPEIHDLNRDRVVDPDLIHPGWVLDLPPAKPLITVEPEVQEDPGDQAGVADATEGDGQAVASDLADAVSQGAETDGQRGVDADETEGPVLSVDGGGSTLAPAMEAPSAFDLLGGMSALSAGAVLSGLGLRRQLQHRHRPLGRRYASPVGEPARYVEALHQVTRPGESHDRAVLLTRAMRHLAHDWWRRGRPAPHLAHAVLGPDDVRFVLDGALEGAPEGFLLLGNTLAITWAALSEADDLDHPVAYPALVTLGELEPGHLVMVDTMGSGVLGLQGMDGETDGGLACLLSSMLVELSSAPWADEVDLLVVTDDPALVAAAGDGRIATSSSPERGVTTIEQLVEERSRFLGDGNWDAGRLDPDLAEAWAAQLVLFEKALSPEELRRLDAATAASRCGVAAIAPVPADRPWASDWVLRRDPTGSLLVDSGGVTATAPTIPPSTRHALTALYECATDTASHPAPWWSSSEEADVNIIALHPVPPATTSAGPRLNLLGPIELVDCAGEMPPRATRQCLEYCAWLLLHPGATPTRMASALLVAEGTRRSNMSRLRSWLGRRPDGGLYLPDAYSGRIALDEAVTSDWDDLRLLVSGGLNRLSLEHLVRALELVRGAPLADAAPGQWGWAEEFRSDAAALIRDLGVVTARKAREAGDLARSRWAANRALTAAPDDELLLGERIRTEHAAGRTDEVERLSRRVIRTARVLRVDLLPETVAMLQEVLEGRLRVRA